MQTSCWDCAVVWRRSVAERRACGCAEDSTASEAVCAVSGPRRRLDEGRCRRTSCDGAVPPGDWWSARCRRTRRSRRPAPSDRAGRRRLSGRSVACCGLYVSAACQLPRRRVGRLRRAAGRWRRRSRPAAAIVGACWGSVRRGHRRWVAVHPEFSIRRRTASHRPGRACRHAV